MADEEPPVPPLPSGEAGGDLGDDAHFVVASPPSGHTSPSRARPAPRRDLRRASRRPAPRPPADPAWERRRAGGGRRRRGARSRTLDTTNGPMPGPTPEAALAVPDEPGREWRSVPDMSTACSRLPRSEMLSSTQTMHRLPFPAHEGAVQRNGLEHAMQTWACFRMRKRCVCEEPGRSDSTRSTRAVSRRNSAMSSALLSASAARNAGVSAPRGRRREKRAGDGAPFAA
jgi:hypothetical protein